MTEPGLTVYGVVVKTTPARLEGVYGRHATIEVVVNPDHPAAAKGVVIYVPAPAGVALPREPLTDEQIIALRKEAFGGRFGRPGLTPWADTLKFARAIEAHVLGVALPADWLPTTENVNALPEPLRRYITDMETLCDPSGLVCANAQLKDCNEGLQRMYRKKADAMLTAEQIDRLDARHLGGFQTREKLHAFAKACVDTALNDGVAVVDEGKTR